VLRFSNLIFEPLWSRQYIKNVQIIFSEDFGTEGRGGYFDQYGILRDVIQNHLLQILALFAMEQPVSLAAEDIRNEKVKVLRAIQKIEKENVVLGQYSRRQSRGHTYPGYIDDATVPNDRHGHILIGCFLRSASLVLASLRRLQRWICSSIIPVGQAFLSCSKLGKR